MLRIHKGGSVARDMFNDNSTCRDILPVLRASYDYSLIVGQGANVLDPTKNLFHRRHIKVGETNGLNNTRIGQVPRWRSSHSCEGCSLCAYV